jgi:hypothetical protein
MGRRRAPGGDPPRPFRLFSGDRRHAERVSPTHERPMLRSAALTA